MTYGLLLLFVAAIGLSFVVVSQMLSDIYTRVTAIYRHLGLDKKEEK